MIGASRKISKILYFVSSPLTKRDEKRYGMEILKDNGFEIEVWDFTPCLQPDRYEHFTPPDRSGFGKQRLIRAKEEAAAEISKLADDCVIICLFEYGRDTYSIFRAISKKDIPYCFYRYSFPSVPLKGSGFVKRLSRITAGKLAFKVFQALPYQWVGIKPAFLIVALGGRFKLPEGLNIGKTTVILHGHHFDYDSYLEENVRARSCDEDLGVFLDQCFPSHPDSSAKAYLAADEYYPLLCRFFDYIEKTRNARIAIAAHPRSNARDDARCFGGREVVQGETTAMVRRSGFVILHDSAAIDFPVLFHKPMVFVTTDALQALRGGLQTYFASWFGKAPINLSQSLEIDWEKEMAVDEKAYATFRNTYIKLDGSEDTPIWRRFANLLRSQGAVSPS
jgi:hypothetical protein